MDEWKIVNRAKWLLIGKLGMSEADAHRYIEKLAMDTRADPTARSRTGYNQEPTKVSIEAQDKMEGVRIKMAKYIFVTGGVVSGLGKGITAGSPSARLLKGARDSRWRRRSSTLTSTSTPAR